MNALLVLTFCGLAAGVFAGPSCSDDEANKCHKLAPSDVWYDLVKSFPNNAEELDHICPGFLEVIQCTLDFSARCPNTLTAFLKDSNLEYQRVYTKLCSKSDPERQQFLDNVPCLNKNVGTITSGCEATTADLPYCDKMAAIGNCIEENVAKKCGKEAQDILHQLYRPREAIYEAFCRGV